MEENYKDGIKVKMDNLKLIIDRCRNNEISVDFLKQHIKELSNNQPNDRGIYSRCIHEMDHCSYLEGKKYLNLLIRIYKDFYLYITGEKYDAIRYNNEFRKKHYRQLNIDLPIELMNDFELILKEKNISKKQFIYKVVDNFVKENKK